MVLLKFIFLQAGLLVGAWPFYKVSDPGGQSDSRASVLVNEEVVVSEDTA